MPKPLTTASSASGPAPRLRLDSVPRPVLDGLATALAGIPAYRPRQDLVDAIGAALELVDLTFDRADFNDHVRRLVEAHVERAIAQHPGGYK